MTITEAMNDPNRPLTIAPRDWMLSCGQRRGSLVVAEKTKEEQGEDLPPDEQALIDIDSSIDMLVEGTKRLQDGLKILRSLDIEENEKKVAEKIQELLDTAIAPYLADIIKELETLETE